ncbi:MAG: DNA polymerase III subunit delta [Bacteroidaceae bacterium]|nr:DNA polymerase III subunit delta [Bacteroidaceae bacterium]
MFFRDIIGQEDIKRQLIKNVQENKIAHAQLFCGGEGVGKLPLAIAYARYISCLNPSEKDACGKCANCVKFNNLAHPDLHFIFPVVKKKSSKDIVSDDYIAEWRELMARTPYFNLPTWLEEMGAENQQAQIYVKESNEIIRKLSLKSSQGGYKIIIIWLPEKMNQECSNKLLKLLEEPAEQTVFHLVSEEPDMLLTTIQSRTQRINIKGIDEKDLKEALINIHGLQEQDAINIAHQSEGNFLKAIESISLNEENKLFFDLFVALMRLSYQRKIKEMKAWSEKVATMGREKQKHFLSYCQRMIRENFIYNFHNRSITYLGNEEEAFSTRFSPFINERNVMEIMNELNEAQRHIEQNVNAKMVFFDFSLKMIVLLIQK